MVPPPCWNARIWTASFRGITSIDGSIIAIPGTCMCVIRTHQMPKFVGTYHDRPTIGRYIWYVDEMPAYDIL